MLSRGSLQGIAEAKLSDAQLLLNAGSHSNAFYLAGYAVEIGLKAAIAKQFLAGVIPEKAFVNDVYTHRLTNLIGLAGLTQALKDESNGSAAFAANWLVVSQWSEASRYEMIDVFRSTELLSGIADPEAGVFPWLRRHW